MILRSRKEGGFYLLGDAYVEGMMEGKLCRTSVMKTGLSWKFIEYSFTVDLSRFPNGHSLIVTFKICNWVIYLRIRHLKVASKPNVSFDI
jgi:hypothetical protein